VTISTLMRGLRRVAAASPRRVTREVRQVTG
jgi:hypothetical protein